MKKSIILTVFMLSAIISNAQSSRQTEIDAAKQDLIYKKYFMEQTNGCNACGACAMARMYEYFHEHGLYAEKWDGTQATEQWLLDNIKSNVNKAAELGKDCNLATYRNKSASSALPFNDGNVVKYTSTPKVGVSKSQQINPSKKTNTGGAQIAK